MIILDSDPLSVLQHPESPQFERLTEVMERSNDQDFATTVVSLEEQMRGWLVAINRAKGVHKQVVYDQRLTKMVDFYSRWKVVDFDSKAADHFSKYRKARVRVATMDLKIAAIAISVGAILLSANLRDFQLVPGLDVQDWLT
jgi:tRNA(fMet)-specific endonuclease VapC